MKGRRGTGRRRDTENFLAPHLRVSPSPGPRVSALPPSAFILSFLLAPLSGDFMAKSKKFMQPRLDHERRCDSAQKPERRFVVYFILQNRAIRVGHNQVPVSPRAKWPFDLHILKHSRWIVRGVFGDPTHLPGTKDRGLNNRP